MASSNTNSTELMPDLRIVPLASLVPHEEHDAQRSEPLAQRIREAGTWLNPPIVAPMDDGRYVILDGANRHYALGALGYTYILVQVVDYESGSVELGTWYHIISGVTASEFLAHICAIEGLKVESRDLLHARAALAQREVIAYTVLQDETAYTMHTNAVTLIERTALLRRIVDTYKQRGVLNRIRTDAISQARKLYPTAQAIVVFPHYEPVEILLAAREGAYLPPGISRHIIAGRAMRLHYPLEAFLEDGLSLEQKNDQLQRWLQECMAARRIRYYAESTYMFDE